MAICASRKCRFSRVILASWAIAFLEYCLAVPANRWGNAVYTTAQLKTMQEVITLIVFVGFSLAYLKEPIGWNHALGFTLIAPARSSYFRSGENGRSKMRRRGVRCWEVQAMAGPFIVRQSYCECAISKFQALQYNSWLRAS